MKLLTHEVRTLLPPLYSQESRGLDAAVRVKFFCPWSNWTWYVTEFDPATGIFFGLVDGMEKEMGYFSLEELEAQRGPGGLTIERDLYWKPQTLRELGAA